MEYSANKYFQFFIEVHESGVLVNGIASGIKNIINSSPWQISLRRNNSHICGATIISVTWAVSAAHCTVGQSVSQLTLLAGTANRLSGGQVRQVVLVVNHSKFNARTSDHDIALLRVFPAFATGNSIRAVVLPNQGASVRSGAYGIVSGWGTVRAGSSSLPISLQVVRLPVVSQATCNAAYFGGITKNMLCAGYLTGGQDACQGDSGDPYVVNGQLVGIVSWGAGCGQPNFPGVYTRVSVYRDWIKTNTGV